MLTTNNDIKYGPWRRAVSCPCGEIWHTEFQGTRWGYECWFPDYVCCKCAMPISEFTETASRKIFKIVPNKMFKNFTHEVFTGYQLKDEIENE